MRQTRGRAHSAAALGPVACSAVLRNAVLRVAVRRIAVRRTAVLCATVLCATVLGVTGCAASAPAPLPTPHYSIDPLVRPGQLRVEGSGASICSTNATQRDVVFGFGVENDDSAPLTLTNVTFTLVSGGRVAGAWTLDPTADLTTPDGLVTSQFSYPPDIPDWNKRAPVHGTTLQPGAYTYLLVRLVRDPGNKAALFLDPAVHYTRLDQNFTEQTRSSGFEYQPIGKCVFSTG